jgi:hypothetical protein
VFLGRLDATESLRANQAPGATFTQIAAPSIRWASPDPKFLNACLIGLLSSAKCALWPRIAAGTIPKISKTWERVNRAAADPTRLPRLGRPRII